MRRTSVANYAEEKALFAELVAADREPNILLFQGESGSGKSHLIEHCLSSVPERLPAARLKLQGRSEAIPGLFAAMGQKVGWEAVPNFTGTVARMLEQPDQADDPLWQMGIHRHLGQIGRVSDQKTRLDRFQVLTDAWFLDLNQLDTPFLLAIDGYEQASSLFKRWFGTDFLYGVANFGRMRVLVGGQEVPAIDSAWSRRAHLRQLKGVSEVEAWLDWAAEAGYEVYSPDILVGIVMAFQGRPSEIVKLIETQFPRREGPIAGGQSEVSRLKELRDAIIEFFSLEDLREVCFNVPIDYENIRGHRDQKSTFARELLYYARRIGLFNRLVEELHAARPHVQWVY